MVKYDQILYKHFWKTEPTGFADGLDVVIRERKDYKDDSQIFGLSN